MVDETEDGLKGKTADNDETNHRVIRINLFVIRVVRNMRSSLGILGGCVQRNQV